MCNLHAHARKDPTRTQTIRKRFEADITRRFRKLRSLIYEAIVTDGGLSANIVQPGRFDFPRSSEKVESFMAWLQQQQQRGDINLIQPTIARPGAIDDRWANVYVDTAYAQGIRRARAEIRRSGIDFPDTDSPAGIVMGFNNPAHADRLGLIYTRLYSDLKGITDEMDKQISRVLAEGLAAGDNPRQIARAITDRVDKVGITRARTLARTEVIRAHHGANVQEYKNAGVEGVRIVAEFVTAGDDRVCEQCAGLEGRIYTISSAEGLIPVHPNCRCVAVPVLREDVSGNEIRKSA